MDRPEPKDCQNEPSYPGHETVLFSIRSPEYYMDKDCIIKKWEALEE